MSINKVILIGHLGADPEVRYTPEGNPVTTFRLATNEVWKDKNGEKQTRTEWHRIVAFNRLAEICGEYLTKGRQVYIEGQIRYRSYEDRDGVKRYVTEIVARNMQMLGARPSGSGESGSNNESFENFDEPPPDDDLPF